MKYFIIILIFFAYKAHSFQNDSLFNEANIDSVWDMNNIDPAQLDSVWNLEELDESELENELKLGTYSKGWFPKILGIRSRYFVSIVPLFTIDIADNVRSEHYYPTVNPHIANDKRTNDQEEMRDSFSDSVENYSVSDGGTIFDFGYSIDSFLPFIVDISLNYFNLNGSVYSINENKQYLDNGQPKNLVEGSHVQVKTYSFGGKLDIIIPVYGAFISADDTEIRMMSLASFYYLCFGLQSNIMFDHNTIQQFQILDNKDEIRYQNGYDLYRVIDNDELPNVNEYTSFYELGIGSRVYLGPTFLDLNFKVGVPFENVINDSEWEQYYIAIGLKVGF